MRHVPKNGESLMRPVTKPGRPGSSRRSFLKKGAAAGVATASAGLLFRGTSAFAEDEKSGRLTPGDAALLRFAAAAEIIETDFWLQYQELAGAQDDEVSKEVASQLKGYPSSPTGGNTLYTNAIAQLDSDMAQYIKDNTDDEFTHQDFLNAYLVSKGASPVSLEAFRTLPSSQATGSNKSVKRLTNLMQLTVDTSWWTRYRIGDHNPDLEPNFAFPQAVPTLATGKHTAIPRTDADTADSNVLQAIANTAGFHFATIEQGGTTLYPAMAQRATHPEVLRILLSIGPTETMHFQTWQDKAGNAPDATFSDPINKSNVVFDLQSAARFNTEDFQKNAIMPEPCPFISPNLPRCSVIRPTETKNIAKGVVKFLTDMGLFIGQPPAFFAALNDLAEDADAAHRGQD